MDKRGKRSQIYGERSERVLRARALLSRVFVSFFFCGYGSIWFSRVGRSISFMGRPAFPFIGQGKARVTAEEKRRTRERRRPSGSSSPSSPSCGSCRSCRCQQGQLHVVALSVTGAMRRRRLSVMAFHPVLVDVVVNWRTCHYSYEG